MQQNDKSLDPAQLPDKEAFRKKEVFQHPQPADEGRPLKEEKKLDDSLQGKQANRSSKEEGLNEESSTGNAGAFEGFEDHEKK